MVFGTVLNLTTTLSLSCLQHPERCSNKSSQKLNICILLCLNFFIFSFIRVPASNHPIWPPKSNIDAQWHGNFALSSNWPCVCANKLAKGWTGTRFGIVREQGTLQAIINWNTANFGFKVWFLQIDYLMEWFV